jgi:hypothetical protein
MLEGKEVALGHTVKSIDRVGGCDNVIVTFSDGCGRNWESRAAMRRAVRDWLDNDENARMLALAFALDGEEDESKIKDFRATVKPEAKK